MKTEAFGKYQVIEKIGEGGFGEVYRGHDPDLKRPVAIKTCKTVNPALLERFVREAEIAARLQHPGIVTVFDFGYRDQTPYLVQEYLPGEDLDRKIKRRDPIDPAVRIDLLRQVALGLRHAHLQGVIHRDVKPANVRVLDDGQVKIMDFGIAKLLNAEVELTQTGVTLGSARYLPPEQFRGGKVDLRADIFSFGVTAYELLTYECPFDGETAARIFYRITHEDPRPIEQVWPQCPPRLARCISTCLQKDPTHRYSDLAPVIAELESHLGGSGGSALLAAVQSAAPPGEPPAGEAAEAPRPPPPPPPPSPTAPLPLTSAVREESRSFLGQTYATLRRPWLGRIAVFALVAFGAFALTFVLGSLWRNGEEPSDEVAASTDPPGEPAVAGVEDEPDPAVEGAGDAEPAENGTPAAGTPAAGTPVAGTPAAPGTPAGEMQPVEPVPVEPPPPSVEPETFEPEASVEPLEPAAPDVSGEAESEVVALEDASPPSPPVAALPPATPVPAQVPRRGVTLFRERDFEGRGESFYGDDPNLRNNSIGNDTVTSVRLDPGCRVFLYEHVDYGGRVTLLTASRERLRGTEVGNDRVSSLRVECGRSAPPASPPPLTGPRGAVLFRDGNFGGVSELFQGNDPNLGNNAIGNDEVSSVRVSPGCQVLLYSRENYQGRETMLTADRADLSGTEVGADQASSVQVVCRRQ